MMTEDEAVVEADELPIEIEAKMRKTSLPREDVKPLRWAAANPNAQVSRNNSQNRSGRRGGFCKGKTLY